MQGDRVHPWAGRVDRRAAAGARTTGGAPAVFLALSADGAPDPADQRSTPRRAITTLAACLVALATPLFWATATATAHELPKAVATKQLAPASDDEGDDGAARDGDPGATDRDATVRTERR